MWHVETGECIKTFEGHNDSVSSVCFSSDGKKIASGGGYYDNTVRVWHVETGECIKTFEGHNDDVCSVCFSSDGKKIASGSDDNTVRVWHVETGECIKTFEGHNGSVSSVCFSSDGKKIASVSWDARFGRVWKTLDIMMSFVLFDSAAMESSLSALYFRSKS